MWAAERGNYNVVKTMIERKVDINVRDNNGVTGKCPPTYNMFCIYGY